MINGCDAACKTIEETTPCYMFQGGGDNGRPGNGRGEESRRGFYATNTTTTLSRIDLGSMIAV